MGYSFNPRLLAGVLLALIVVAGAVVTLGSSIISQQQDAATESGVEDASGAPVFFEPQIFTLPVGPGSSGSLSFTVYVESSVNGESREDSGSLSFKVEGYEWPHARLSYIASDNGEEKQGVLPFAMLGLPEELIGSETLGLPIYIPVVDATLCVEATLSRENGLLVYRGEEIIGSTLVNVEAAYRGDGVLDKLKIELSDPQAGRILYEARLSFERTQSYATRGAWACSDGLYSDIRYAPEGLIEIRDGRVYKVGLDTVRNAVETETLIFMVLSKTCPYCQKDWEHILKLSTMIDVKIYAINAGGLTPQDELAWAVNFARKLGVAGTPSFIAIKDGRVADIKVGYATAEELASWAESTLGVALRG